MRLVECETLDAFDLIDMYDSPKTFFYINPPPKHSKTVAYLSNGSVTCKEWPCLAMR